MKLLIKIILLLFIGFSTNTAIAGWVISEVSSDKFGNKQFQTTFIQNNIIRYETESSVAIINLNTNNITLIFGLYRLYWEGTIEEFKEGTMEVFEKKLENIISTAPPEQKEIAKDLIVELRKELAEAKSDTLVDLSLEIVETNIQEQISGFNSVKYDILVKDSLVESIWITDSINPYLDIDLERMVSFTNQLKPDHGNTNIEGSSDYLKLINKGFAIKSQTKNPLGGYYSTIVSSVIEREINVEIFLPSPDYRKALLSEILLINEQNSDSYRLRQEFEKAKSNPLYD